MIGAVKSEGDPIVGDATKSCWPQIVVGSGGLIGRRLFGHLQRSGIHVLGSTRRPGDGDLCIDMSTSAGPYKLPQRISACYILAGITSMAECETHRAETWAVNVDATLALANSAIERGAHVVVVSTNLVFDGRKPFARVDDPIAPQNRYAVEKAEVERRLLASGSASVLRITKIAESLTNLVTGWSHQMEAGQAIHPFSDLVSAPIPLLRVVEALTAIGAARECGAYHLSADRDIAYSEIAARLAVKLALDQQLVIPTTSLLAGVKMSALPQHTTLDMAESVELLGAPADPWSALDTVFSDVCRALVVGTFNA